MMRTVLTISRSVLMLLAVAALAGARLNCQTLVKTEAGKPLQLTLPSKVLSEDRRILIRLPREYERDTTARYPVLYKFDGDNQLKRYDDTIDVLNSADLIPDLIVVAIPNGRGLRNRDLTPPVLHQNDGENGQMGTGEMGGGGRFLEFLEQELIPYVEGHYRTSRERILAGHSRGALLVLYSLLSRPGLFEARFIFSAPLMRDEQRLIADTRAFFRNNPGHESFLYCNWGENENDGMNRSYAAMKTLLAGEAPKGLRWTIERARAADHQQTPLIALPAALYEYFSGNATAVQKNRTATVRSGSSSRKP